MNHNSCAVAQAHEVNLQISIYFNYLYSYKLYDSCTVLIDCPHTLEISHVMSAGNVMRVII